ncbi:VOC family protein [Pontivivens ytuae]|uniref:VOC family protein n=1 Tax=Pontivivens ytuae TaxID=2789856 RepID=A0A7S9LTS8_9RHOB|nr:VOC family protein [Pontivivens ytuae]QPH55134.1 VOC family protein [Pontivivens ytuae]
MAHATGIGGLFFRARDPEALSAWYAARFGIDGVPWMQQAGPTVFQPFDQNTHYWPGDRQWMVNLRVDDIDTLIETLRGEGLAVETRDEWDDPKVGRFARVNDPEGNPVEMWEPAEERR